MRKNAPAIKPTGAFIQRVIAVVRSATAHRILHFPEGLGVESERWRDGGGNDTEGKDGCEDLAHDSLLRVLKFTKFWACRLPAGGVHHFPEGLWIEGERWCDGGGNDTEGEDGCEDLAHDSLLLVWVLPR